MSETYTLVEATMKVIQDRRSVREFTPEPVADQDLDMILEAGRQAPSATARIPRHQPVPVRLYIFCTEPPSPEALLSIIRPLLPRMDA